jgi:putative endopeptidase
MDEAMIEAKGLGPLRPHLNAIAAIRGKHELARALGESLRSDVDPLNAAFFRTPNLFGLWVGPGFNDPEHFAAYLLQGGLEMPDRDYYLSDSDSMKDIRVKYQGHVSALLKLAGFTDSEVRARHIVELEHAIAEKHIALADQQDIEKVSLANCYEGRYYRQIAPRKGDASPFLNGLGGSETIGFAPNISYSRD